MKSNFLSVLLVSVCNSLAFSVKFINCSQTNFLENCLSCSLFYASFCSTNLSEPDKLTSRPKNSDSPKLFQIFPLPSPPSPSLPLPALPNLNPHRLTSTHRLTPPPLMLAALSPSWLLPKRTARRLFESNSPDVSRLCIIAALIFSAGYYSAPIFYFVEQKKMFRFTSFCRFFNILREIFLTSLG